MINTLSARALATIALLTIVMSAFPASVFIADAAATEGSVLVTEALPNPAGSDALGEYIVLTNVTTGVMDITNWELDDGGTSVKTLSGAIAAGSVLKICADTTASSTASGCDVEWSSMSLSNAGDSITLKDENGTTVDTVSYTATDVTGSEGVVLTFNNSHTDLTVHNVEDDLYFATVTDALAAATTDDGETIELTADLDISAEIHLNRPIILDGNGHTIYSEFAKTSNSNNSAIGVSSDTVTIRDLKLTNTNVTGDWYKYLHGVNVYRATGVTVSNVSVDGYLTGLVVNGSTVDVDNFTSSNSAWHGINVDQGKGVTEPSVLNISAVSIHGETTAPHIFVDDIAKNVTVNDLGNQYDYTDISGEVTARAYFLKTDLDPLNTDQTAYTSPHGKVSVCHLTGEGYTDVHVDINSIIGGTGHGGHENDIIPSFWYATPSTSEPQLYTGNLWDLDHKDAYNTNCGSTPESTSSVTMCKYDANQNALSGWTLNLLGSKVETVTVPSNGTTVYSQNTLDGDYVFLANGTYVYRPGVTGSISDAAFTMRTPGNDPINPTGYPYNPWVAVNDLGNFNSAWAGFLGITVDDALGTTDWGSIFNPLHEYALQYLGTGSAASFQMIDSSYGDNSGSLSVDIYGGYTGVTGEDGCTTFTDVPYGDYTVDEINQDGWWNVSGLGSVTVDADFEHFDVVNTDVEPVAASLTITDTASDYEVLSGTHIFKAEYVDADTNPDHINWAIRAGTCNANTGTVVGNVDGHHDTDNEVGGVLVGSDWEATVDMSTWSDGDYCLVVNPTEDSGTDFRATRWFKIENPAPVASCVANVNLLANPSFEEPTITGAWSLVNPVGWIVKKLTSNGSLKMEIQKHVNSAWVASDGSQYTELDSTESSRISQVIPTIADKRYTLTWDFSPRPGRGTIDNQLDVMVNGVQVDHNQTNGIGVSATEWENHSYSFIGDGSDVEITFADGGTSNSLGTLLDNVSLTCNPNTGTVSYCGDGVIDDSWEQCELGDEGCTDTCQLDNQCHYSQLMKIDLNDTVAQSASFNGKVYIGANDKLAPVGYWFNVNEFGNSSAYSIAHHSGFDGLAIGFDGSDMQFAWNGGNKSKHIDYVQGNLSFLGFGDITNADITGEINGTSYKLETPGKGFPDVFAATSPSTINFDMRADTGDDGVTLALTATETGYGMCSVEVPTYRISGSKWNDTNSDGIWDEDEYGVEGWPIYAFNESSEETLSTTTDANGEYFFDVAGGDTWNVYGGAVEGWTQTGLDMYPIGEAFGYTDEDSCHFSLRSENWEVEPKSFSCDFGNHTEATTTTNTTVTTTTSGGGGGGQSATEGFAARHGGGSSPVGQVLGASTDMCPQYLTETIMPGKDNNPAEVTRLQKFLHDIEGYLGVSETGVYDAVTQSAVGDFQDKYIDKILAPWGINTRTLNVYYTTRKTINEIYCGWTREFPLSDPEQAEIDWYRKIGHVRGLVGVTEEANQEPKIGATAGNEEDNMIIGARDEAPTNEEEADSVDQTAAVGNAGEGFFGGIGKFLKGLFGG